MTPSAELRRLGVNKSALPHLLPRAITLGADTLVSEILETLRAGSKKYGWSQLYDGGSRQAYAKALIAAKGDDGRRQAIALFASDYTDGSDIRSLLQDLEEIVNIFFERPPVPQIWSEIVEHISQLVDISESDALPLESVDLPPTNEQSVLIDLLFEHLHSPVLSLAREARQGIAELISANLGLSRIEPHMRRLLAGTDADQLVAVTLLAGLSEYHLDWVSLFAKELSSIAWSRSLIIRRVVHPLLVTLDIPFENDRPSRSAPSIYTLHLPEPCVPSLKSAEVVPPGEPLPDTSDPFELVRMFEGALEQISSDTDVSLNALVTRFAALMREVSDPASWSAAAEQAISDQLQAIALPCTYRRPRSLAAQRAFGYLLAELVDAELIPWPYEEIDEWLVPVDAVMENVEPDLRPMWLRLHEGTQPMSVGSSAWVDAVSSSTDLMPHRTPEGGLVLAEFTSIQHHEFGIPRETRISMLALPNYSLKTKSEFGLATLGARTWYLASEYPRLYGFTPLPVTAVAGNPYFAEAEFLAVNPHLAFALGWRPSTSGLFRWVNAEGVTMVESIHWQDGNCNHRGGYGYKETGAYGWLVVATPEAEASLRSALKHFERKSAVERILNEHSLKPERKVIVKANPV